PMVRDRESVNLFVVIPGPFAASSRKEPDCVGRTANANAEAAEGERQGWRGSIQRLDFHCNDEGAWIPGSAADFTRRRPGMTATSSTASKRRIVAPSSLHRCHGSKCL
ncbi:MAG TPA: hypothetical protein VIM92_03225, partial [Rhodanobacteraceae bacterium]